MVQVGDVTRRGKVVDVQVLDGKNLYDVEYNDGTGIAAWEDMMAPAPGVGGKRKKKTRSRKGKSRRTRKNFGR